MANIGKFEVTVKPSACVSLLYAVKKVLETVAPDECPKSSEEALIELRAAFNEAVDGIESH